MQILRNLFGKKSNYTEGLRPLGNKKRLTRATSADNYDVRMILFRDKESAERYYDLFVAHAQTNPPPFVIEIMSLFIPKNIFAEKYAVVIPNEDVDTRPGYEEWARNAMWACNETLRMHNSTDHKYTELDRYVDVVYRWNILVPKGFSATSPEGQALLKDDPDQALPALRRSS